MQVCTRASVPQTSTVKTKKTTSAAHRGLQLLGLSGLGMGGGFERLHYLLETAFDTNGELSIGFLRVRSQDFGLLLTRVDCHSVLLPTSSDMADCALMGSPSSSASRAQNMTCAQYAAACVLQPAVCPA